MLKTGWGGYWRSAVAILKGNYRKKTTRIYIHIYTHKRNLCCLDNHWWVKNCDLTVTLYLICRVLVFLGFLHQEEASVQVRIRFPHRIKRRWVSLFVTAAFLSVRMMSRLKISLYNYFWSILYQPLSYINMQVTCKMTCFHYQLAESLLSAFLIIDCLTWEQ